jgi:hypothetical protein
MKREFQVDIVGKVFNVLNSVGKFKPLCTTCSKGFWVNVETWEMIDR